MPVKIFFCYAHEDEALLNKLKAHLRPLQRQGLIDVWHDRDIYAGMEWEQEINRHLKEAQIILLLISPDFMDSDYCYGIEMTRAMERHYHREARVIPVILRPVYWQGILGGLQALPIDGTPVMDSSWHTLDEAFLNITKAMLEAIKEFFSMQSIEQGFVDCENSDSGNILSNKSNLDDPNPYSIEGSTRRLTEFLHYGEKLAAYDQAIRLDPKNSYYYNCKGCILAKFGRYEEALTVFEQAIQLNPRGAHLYNNKGQALTKLGRYEEALVAFEQGIRIAAETAYLYNNKGHALFGLRRYEEALIAFSKAAIILNQREPFS